MNVEEKHHQKIIYLNDFDTKNDVMLPCEALLYYNNRKIEQIQRNNEKGKDFVAFYEHFIRLDFNNEYLKKLLENNIHIQLSEIAISTSDFNTFFVAIKCLTSVFLRSKFISSTFLSLEFIYYVFNIFKDLKFKNFVIDQSEYKVLVDFIMLTILNNTDLFCIFDKALFISTLLKHFKVLSSTLCYVIRLLDAFVSKYRYSAREPMAPELYEQLIGVCREIYTGDMNEIGYYFKDLLGLSRNLLNLNQDVQAEFFKNISLVQPFIKIVNTDQANREAYFDFILYLLNDEYPLIDNIKDEFSWIYFVNLMDDSDDESYICKLFKITGIIIQKDPSFRKEKEFTNFLKHLIVFSFGSDESFMIISATIDLFYEIVKNNTVKENTVLLEYHLSTSIIHFILSGDTILTTKILYICNVLGRISMENNDTYDEFINGIKRSVDFEDIKLLLQSDSDEISQMASTLINQIMSSRVE